jgi:hypothetical protein
MGAMASANNNTSSDLWARMTWSTLSPRPFRRSVTNSWAVSCSSPGHCSRRLEMQIVSQDLHTKCFHVALNHKVFWNVSCHQLSVHKSKPHKGYCIRLGTADETKSSVYTLASLCSVKFHSPVTRTLSCELIIDAPAQSSLERVFAVFVFSDPPYSFCVNRAYLCPML